MTPTETVQLLVTLNGGVLLGFVLGRLSLHPVFRGGDQ